MQNELIKTPEKQLVPVIDLEQLVVNTNAIIKIDVDLSIQYIDARVASFAGESEELEAELKKWYKDFAARRLDLTRPVNESLKQVIADEKKIGDYLDKIFAENKAKREAAEAERKKAKYAEVMTTMADMLNSVDLPSEYLAKVVFREEYYNKTMVNKKLADSIQAQIDDQVKLYNGWKAEQELKQQKIKNRELLLQNLNQQYGFNGVYSQFTIEMYSDEQVEQAYKNKKEKQDAEEVKKQAVTETESVVCTQQNNADTSQQSLQKSPNGNNEVRSQEVVKASNQPRSQDANSVSTLSKNFVTKTITITIDAGSAERSAGAMATVEKRLAEMRDNFATKYGVKMEICQQ
ncbi:MAG: hypothetical protein EKK54_07985 [Neisseriaceae bacterium]|nr:MAG: hypothetical protein EKK54_07985 [Neisseriaceae bacterium]